MFNLYNKINNLIKSFIYNFSDYNTKVVYFLRTNLTRFIDNLIPDKDIEKTSILFWVISIFCFLGIIWGSTAKINQVVRAQGEVIPVSKIQVIQSVYGGVIEEIGTSLGDKVKKGDILFIIDETRAKAGYSGNEESYEATLLEVETRTTKVEIMEDLFSKGAESEMRLLDERLALVDAKRRLSQMSTQRDALKLQVDQSIIRAPRDGIISAVNITTEGQVVKEGELLAELVPEGEKLLVEAKVNTKDIAFVKNDQKARIIFTAYDPSVYGMFDGRVVEVAASSKIDQKTNIPYYSSIIELDETPDFRDVSIQSGMTTEISIIGQERTVFGFIFNPVTKLTREAFRE